MATEIYVGGSTYMLTRVETTFGTYNSGGTDDLRNLITNFNPTMKNNFIRIYGLGGGRNFVTAVPGKYEASGSFDLTIQNGQFLKYVFGTASAATTCTTDFDGTTITGTPTSALKRYAITEATNLSSFTMDLRYLVSSANDLQQRFLGCKINQMALKADVDNELKATLDFIAQTTATVVGTLATPTTLAYNDPPKMFYQAKLLLDVGDAGTGTGTASTWTDSTKAWTVNAWATYVLLDPLGAAFVIASNTATALTVTGTPTTGVYTISPSSATAAVQVINCTSVGVTLTNNLEAYWSITNDTGRGLKFTIEKQREYSIDMDMLLINGEQLGRLYTGVASATSPGTTASYTTNCLVLNYTYATNLGDGFKAIRFVFTDVVIDENSLPTDPKEMIKQSVKAFAKTCTVYYATNEAS